MGTFSFRQDVHSLFMKALTFSKGRPSVIEAAKRLKAKFKLLEKEIDEIPVKGFNSEGQYTPALRNMLNVIQNFQSELK